MKNTINFLVLLMFLSVMLVFWHSEAKAQTYLPTGPQTNVPVSTVTGGGWTECYRDKYNIHMNANTVLSLCQGSQLMLSCRQTGSSTLTLLAQGSRSDVTFDTGDNSDVTHIANGVGWYFNTTTTESWGFVKAGDSVEKNNCDVDTSGTNDERLCWHLNGNGGYRCGVTESLNGSTDYERIVYTNVALSVPVPTLSEWGLTALAGILGIAGFMVLRRKRVVA